MSEDPGRLVLGIETSCDETAAALLEDGKTIISNVIASQIPDHAHFGGVVPEIASRRHLQNLLSVVEQALSSYKLHDVTGIAVTQGPGLLGALLVGFSFAKALAWAEDIPLVGVNHLEGHLCALNINSPTIPFPHLALLVSGGHTSIFLVKNQHERQEVGRTTDDAAGEAFDKVAKILGLGYPGGIVIDKLAQNGNPQAIHFPRPLLKNKNFDFSFSGLKTAVMQYFQNNKQEKIEDICASFQAAVIETLVNKTLNAAERFQTQHIILAGGVAANSGLRTAFTLAAQKNSLGLSLPEIALCTDNAAMIAAAGAVALRAGQRLAWSEDAFSRNFQAKLN